MREENAAYHRLNEIVASLAADPAPPPVRHAHAVGSNGASPSAWNVVVHGVPVHVPPNAVVCLGKGPGVRGTCWCVGEGENCAAASECRHCLAWNFQLGESSSQVTRLEYH